MSLKERMEKFNKRWNIVSNDSDEESFKKFKQRILNILKNIDNHITDDSIAIFCQWYGIEEVWHGGYSHSYSTNISDRLNQENDEKEFYRLIELIFSLDITQTRDYGRRCIYSKNILLKKIKEAIELSNVNITISISGDDIILYPKGEESLDNKLINNTLSFLNKESNSHFEQSLKFYQLNNSVKSAESLRRALEEFLRHKLQNSKGLDVNLKELQVKLKSDNKDPQVRNIIFQTFAYIDEYFNNKSKHNDGDIDVTENEFLIYQVGLLLRYINKSIE